MTAFDIREALCEVGRRVWQRGYVASNDGNFSFRLGQNSVLATPTMISKGFMAPEDLVLVDLDGSQTGGSRRLTSEIRLHLNAYRRRPDIRSVLHVHPPHATAFAITGMALPKCVLPEIEFFIGEVPLAPYATPGSWDFARSLDPWLDTHDVFLLRNHGAVTLGADPFDCFYKMETLDQYCRILILARPLGGGWNQLSAAQMAELLAAKESWGVNDPRDGLPPGALCTPEVFPRESGRSHYPFAAQSAVEFPIVTDEPKASTAPPPKPVEEDIRAIVEETVRRVLGGPHDATPSA
ncbi:class II aldolase/adducin family protein [Candidatus Poribacteria bacterium]|nr:class II aldolase/adducin family protein [Candidatus Poribacteria bacterium]